MFVLRSSEIRKLWTRVLCCLPDDAIHSSGKDNQGNHYLSHDTDRNCTQSHSAESHVSSGADMKSERRKERATQRERLEYDNIAYEEAYKSYATDEGVPKSNDEPVSHSEALADDSSCGSTDESPISFQLKKFPPTKPEPHPQQRNAEKYPDTNLAGLSVVTVFHKDNTLH